MQQSLLQKIQELQFENEKLREECSPNDAMEISYFSISFVLHYFYLDSSKKSLLESQISELKAALQQQQANFALETVEYLGYKTKVKELEEQNKNLREKLANSTLKLESLQRLNDDLIESERKMSESLQMKAK
jgi:hypothetical protein